MTQPIKWHDDEVHELLDTEDGPVGRDLLRRGMLVANRQRELLSLPGAGRVYTTRFFTTKTGRVVPYGTRAPHQASAPGEPPAVDYGRLRASIGTNLREDEKGMRVDIGSGANPAIPGVKYAAYLELGTSKMEPRPFLRRSLDAAGD